MHLPNGWEWVCALSPGTDSSLDWMGRPRSTMDGTTSQNQETRESGLCTKPALDLAAGRFRLCREPISISPARQSRPHARRWPAASSVAKGSAVVLGPSGIGKTLLCQMLAEQFRDTLRTAVLSKGQLTTRRAILQAILYELKQPYRGMDESELRLALVDYITRSEECRAGVLLVVDEAHRLSLRLLDEIRMLTDLASEGQPRVRLILAGTDALEERLASPKLESLNQRIVARRDLEPLGRSETEQYIHAQLAAVGGAGRAGFRHRGLPGRSPRDRRRAAFDQPALRSCPAAGLRGQPRRGRRAVRRGGVGRFAAIAGAADCRKTSANRKRGIRSSLAAWTTTRRLPRKPRPPNRRPCRCCGFDVRHVQILRKWS